MHNGDEYLFPWDVNWPASSTDWHLAVFDWASGKAIKDGWAVPTVPTNVSSFNNDSWYLTSSTWVTSVNWNTWAVTVNEVPSSWTTDYVLTKTANWYWWAAPSWWIVNDTTWTTSTVTGIWAGSEAEYWNITPSWTVLYFTF